MIILLQFMLFVERFYIFSSFNYLSILFRAPVIKKFSNEWNFLYLRQWHSQDLGKGDGPFIGYATGRRYPFILLNYRLSVNLKTRKIPISLYTRMANLP